ncbi:hypothetical protein K3495_g2984 [Podosphaera aphanis]|nr:hypothetical protein K3495_g2984 [Podosphaera aphanis]
MESHEFETVPTLKRKHSPVRCSVDENGCRIGAGNVTLINYMMKARSEKLRLIEGDNETFMDILGLIDDYEGVLQRHESLAANLGARLVAPLLLKSFEKLFEGPIKIIQHSHIFLESPVTWLDIVAFARTNPKDFYLIDKENLPGQRICRFWIKGGQVEISEDDFRLIMSGGPERMIPTQPIAEDEAAELGTLTILEARLAVLIKKADAVASKARQLNYHLKGRKTAVLSRKAATESHPVTGTEPSLFSQPFTSTNTHSRNIPMQNGDTSVIQARLLEQYLSPKRRQISTQRLNSEASRSPDIEVDRGISHPPMTYGIGTEGRYRAIMAAKIEKLNRGDPIWPPCDRCRRLRFDCAKHLTACQACTKKHAKCSWKDVKQDELESGSSPNKQPAIENGYNTKDSEPGGLSSPRSSTITGITEKPLNSDDQIPAVSNNTNR